MLKNHAQNARQQLSAVFAAEDASQERAGSIEYGPNRR